MGFLQALVFSYALTLGMSNGAFDQYQPGAMRMVEVNLPLYIDMQTELALGPAFIDGAVRVDFKPSTFPSFVQNQNTYSVGGGLRFVLSPGLTMEARYRHSCYHPTQPYSLVHYLEGETLAVPRYEGALDVFSITVKGRMGGKGKP